MNKDIGMTRLDALKLDNNGSFYTDYDEDSACYGVFGTESGFCYALETEDNIAEEIANKMNEKEF